MEYIVVFNKSYNDHAIMENSNYFIETFSSYEDAKEAGEEWLSVGDCEEYDIYALCSDERNHLI